MCVLVPLDAFRFLCDSFPGDERMIDFPGLIAWMRRQTDGTDLGYSTLRWEDFDGGLCDGK